MKIKLKLNIIVVVIAFVLSGCQSAETVNYENEDKILVYSIDKIPKTLINKEDTTERENDIICALFEGLVELNESGNVIPSLCQEWEVSDDGLEYTFKIREDVKWNSGEKITSFDFIDYFKYILSPDNENYNLEELYVICGASDYKNGFCTFEDVKIKAIDNRTIIIKLNSIDEDFLRNLSKPVYRLRDINEPLDNYKNNYSNIRYTGAYIIDSVSANEIILKKNSYYLGDINVNSIEELKIKERDSLEEDFALYNLGDIDILSAPPALSLDKGTLYTNIGYCQSNIIKTLIFNNENSLVSDIRFRQGLFNGTFLEILDSYMIKYGLGTWAFNEIKYNDLVNKTLNLTKEYNIDEELVLKESAKNLLSQLDTRKKTISLVAKDISENKIICEFISDILEEYDISTRITLLNDEKLNSYLEKKDFDIYIYDLNLTNYQLGSGYDFTTLEENLKNEYSIISLYYKNFIWCKSNSIEYLYIDGNGNLILKYIKV